MQPQTGHRLFNLPSPIQPVHYSGWQHYGCEVWVKRDDLIHPVISGNKWRKLNYFVERMHFQGRRGLVTPGGAYSNHLRAVAHAGKVLGFQTVGLVRGNELNSTSNPVLEACAADGMDLRFLDRETYAQRAGWEFIEGVKASFPELLWVPEGGMGFDGVNGCTEIWNEIDDAFDAVIVAAGTGTTAAGLLASVPANLKVYAVAVGGDIGQLKATIARLLSEFYGDEETAHERTELLRILTSAHTPKYGLAAENVMLYGRQFTAETGIPIDSIYNNRVVYAIGHDPELAGALSGKRLVWLHTGGTVLSN